MSPIRALPIKRRSAKIRAIWTKTGARMAETLMTRSTPRRVVGALAGDRHVVDVALPQARTGDADESRLLLEFLKVRRAHVAHGGATASGELVQDAGDRPLVGDLALDSLRHQLQGVPHLRLEVAVLFF